MKLKINKSDLKRYNELDVLRSKYGICHTCFNKMIKLLEREEIEKKFASPELNGEEKQ